MIARMLRATALLLLALVVANGARAQEFPLVQGQHVDAQLVPEQLAAVPGETLWVALRLVHAERWHTYWLNPGEAGLPTRIEWQLPPGVSAGSIGWPTPERFDLPGNVTDFGYTGEIFLLVPLSIDAGFNATELSLGADARWLECDDVCIPGGATLSLTLPVQQSGAAPINSDFAYGFAATRATLPRQDVPLNATFFFRDGQMNLLVQTVDHLFEGARGISFIPDENGLVDYTAAQDVNVQLASLQLTQAQYPRLKAVPERIGGLLLVDGADGRQVSYQVVAQPDPLAESAIASELGAGREATPTESLPLPLVFGFALLGGLILNLMPCVFPVLSLKVLSLAQGAHGPLRTQRLHGLAYAAGVILSFLLLAVVLLALQAGGAAIGWGFQLQQPWFVAALVFLFFVMGLSMSGVVEFGTSLMGVGGALQEREGYKGSFFTGVLASVVASPCTAPFMGAALGFAFTQSMLVALTVFVALGLGMALPFLVFSFVPTLARLLPKPGAWMLTFRQILAFPLYATAVWLLWVLGQQGGVNAMALVVGGCVLLAFACWLWQRRHVSGWRRLGYALSLGSVALTATLLFSPLLRSATSSTLVIDGAEAFEPYSAARLAALRAEGKPVFVNMTAAWCITCLVNERAALDRDAVRRAFAERRIVALKGDWTRQDPEITAFLQQFGRSGVPLYLLYDKTGTPTVLPQLLTEASVLAALEKI